MAKAKKTNLEQLHICLENTVNTYTKATADFKKNGMLVTGRNGTKYQNPSLGISNKALDKIMKLIKLINEIEKDKSEQGGKKKMEKSKLNIEDFKIA